MRHKSEIWQLINYNQNIIDNHPDYQLDLIDDLARDCGFVSHEIYFIQEAFEQALLSDFDRTRLGCVIVYKGHIIGEGYNSEKTNTLQKAYNIKYRNFDNVHLKYSTHAEVDAIRSIKASMIPQINWSKVEVYTYRIALGYENIQAMSLPCNSCMHILRDLGVHKFIFSTSYGFAKEIHRK